MELTLILTLIKFFFDRISSVDNIELNLQYNLHQRLHFGAYKL